MTAENWIAEVPEKVQRTINERMDRVELPPGSILKNAGDAPTAMYQIEEGYLRLLGLHVDGRQLLIQIYGPGNCFGETPIVANRPFNHTTRALTNVVARRLGSNAFWDLYRQHPEISEALCRKFAANISRQFIHSEIRSSHRLSTVVAMLFVDLAAHCGEKSDSGAIKLWVPITQNDIAEHLRITRQAAQRAIGPMIQSGLLTKHRGTWTINDLDALRRTHILGLG